MKSQALHSSAWWEDETREIQTQYQESLFCHDDSQAVEQVDQRGCAGSVLGGFQETTR